ncbi:hypothetical protein GCM10025862_14720 [Arsenicicoccus piscis]|uniref:Uncharacterized protein n=1 Tax=Arsenicicoccus piscis TaxID=673954 RepID=A0ABQ6HLV2_9MICO|nr:hypothetical protein GCM10025862_14720 [Arsenicicoccus piscis]
MEDVDHLVATDDDQAVRLGETGGELGDELRRGHPDRAGDPLLVGDGVAQVLTDLRGPPERAARARHVEERLVEAERLDQRGDRAEDRHHRLGHLAVALVLGGEHDRLGAQPPGAGHRHRRGHPEGAGLIGRRQHHTPVATTDDDRRAVQVGVVEEGHGGVERVHVDVQDRT